MTQDESLWRRLDLGLVTVPAGVVGQVSYLLNILSESM